VHLPFCSAYRCERKDEAELYPRRVKSHGISRSRRASPRVCKGNRVSVAVRPSKWPSRTALGSSQAVVHPSLRIATSFSLLLLLKLLTSPVLEVGYGFVRQPNRIAHREENRSSIPSRYSFSLSHALSSTLLYAQKFNHQTRSSI
jgi:hypothetical protein